jgi:hypothetical protein
MLGEGRRKKKKKKEQGKETLARGGWLLFSKTGGVGRSWNDSTKSNFLVERREKALLVNRKFMQKK